MVVNVYISAVTPDNISRHELLAWVNDSIQSSLSKIEEMSTGAAYCQMTHLLFPDNISLKKIKFNSRNEVDWINNWKVLQTSWKNLGIDKPVPVERLLRAKFQENFEFLQWFKKFFDANYTEVEYDAVGARGGEAFPTGGKGPAARPAARAAPAAAAPAARKPLAPVATRAAAPTRTAPAKAAPAPATNALLAEKDEIIRDLEEKNAEYQEQVDTAFKERDFYYEKLRAVEEYLEGKEGAIADAVKAILYATDDGEGGVVAQEEEALLSDEAPAAVSPVPVPVPAAVAVGGAEDDETF